MTKIYMSANRFPQKNSIPMRAKERGGGMEISLDELIKWILLQFDDAPSDEKYLDAYRGLLGKEEGDADEQNRDKRSCKKSAEG